MGDELIEPIDVGNDVVSYIETATCNLFNALLKKGSLSIDYRNILSKSETNQALRSPVVKIPVGKCGSKIFELPFSCDNRDGTPEGNCVSYMVIGRTGTGKSSFMNSIIINGARKYSPDDLCFWLIDFKYGKGVKVSAVGNPQMQIYALGAYDKFNFEYRIERVRMTIVQPRIDNLSEYEITALDLLRWTKDTLTPKAQEAFSGKGTQNPGEWCRFCKVKCRCRALSEQSLNTALSESNPQLLAPDELADILPKLDTIKLWIAGIEDYALHTALSGTIIPGWKVVEGRSTRKITNPSAVSDALTSAGIARDTIYKPQELLAITELERLVGRKQFAALCAQWISKPQGKPTLVPNTDKRQAINTVEDDFADIH